MAARVWSGLRSRSAGVPDLSEGSKGGGDRLERECSRAPEGVPRVQECHCQRVFAQECAVGQECPGQECPMSWRARRAGVPGTGVSAQLKTLALESAEEQECSRVQECHDQRVFAQECAGEAGVPRTGVSAELESREGRCAWDRSVSSAQDPRAGERGGAGVLRDQEWFRRCRSAASRSRRARTMFGRRRGRLAAQTCQR